MNVVAIQAAGAGTVTWIAPRNVVIRGWASTQNNTYFVLSSTIVSADITTPGTAGVRYDLLSNAVNTSTVNMFLAIRVEKGESISVIMAAAGTAFLYLD